MTILRPADPDGIAFAAALLRAGRLVAFGTETVYGLGADATDAAAVARLYEAKGRPRFNPLICHYPDADSAFRDVIPTGAARSLAGAFWPGPLTLVLPRAPGCRVALLTSAGLDSLAVRVPAPEAARAMLQAAGRPIAAPSANVSGSVSPTTSAHVLAGLGGRIDAVLDTGACPVGLESTVIDLAGATPVLLRHGGVTLEALTAVIGPVTVAGQGAADGPLRSPGMLTSHYAPCLPLRVEAVSAGVDEALLAFGPPLPGAGATFQLSEGGDVVDAASRLFEGLRWLDAEGTRLGLRGIAAMVVPQEGLGVAVNDRLRRAAAPR